MGGRDLGRRLLVGLVSLTMLAGCGAGASSTPATFGPVTVVTGTSRCFIAASWTTDADGTWHVRDDYDADRCTLTTDDPRVSGKRSSTWNIDLWGIPSEGVGAAVQWGTARLEKNRTIYKFGVSGGRIRLDGKSYRAERQVRDWARRDGNTYESEIIETADTRVEILEYEKAMVTLHRQAYGWRPRGNELPTPWGAWPYP